MKYLELDAIHFRILTIVRLCFSKVFGRFFHLKIVSLLGFLARKPERAMQKTGLL
jgi:hypothetical protein